MGCGASTNKNDDVAERVSNGTNNRGASVTFQHPRTESSVLPNSTLGRSDSVAPTVSVGRMSQSSLASQQLVINGLPAYTIIDSRGCRVTTSIQSKPKVDSICKWLDQAKKFREETASSGPLHNPQDAASKPKEPQTEPTPRDKDTSSVSSKQGLLSVNTTTVPLSPNCVDSSPTAPPLPFRTSLAVNTDSDQNNPPDDEDKV